jgi:hypothetical protein
MKILKTTSLYHDPSKRYVEAQVVHLTADRIEGEIHKKWWSDESLKDIFDPEPIDRHWDWHASSIDYEERRISSEKIGIIAGGNVQGVMLISTETVPSVLEPGAQALFVERLFTAPRNRPGLRRDGRNFLKGVGLELLTWGAFQSRDSGYDGRLLLDASPDFVWWYEQKAHLLRLDRTPIVFEGVTYTPMELPASGADALLDLWKGD